MKPRNQQIDRAINTAVEKNREKIIYDGKNREFHNAVKIDAARILQLRAHRTIENVSEFIQKRFVERFGIDT